MRILVTGGAGFIGSAVCRYLVREADAVVCNIDKLTYAASPASLAPIASSPRYEFHKIDVTDASAVAGAIAAFRPDAIMHLAAESHVDRSIGAPGDFVHTNIVGTYTMLRCALDYWRTLTGEAAERFRFLHVSTDEVFGSLGPSGLFTETSPYEPRSPYSASKAASDHLVRAWFHTYGLPTLVSNCSNNYGPYHFPEKLIPLTIINALEGKPLLVYGDGSNVRDWLYVEDHARALHAIVVHGRPGHSYNVGGHSERRNIDVVTAICDAVDGLVAPADRRKLIRFVADRPGHDHRYAIDSTKLETELGWRPQLSFEGGLAGTVRWYLENESWWRPLRSRYQGERLGTLPEQVTA